MFKRIFLVLGVWERTKEPTKCDKDWGEKAGERYLLPTTGFAGSSGLFGVVGRLQFSLICARRWSTGPFSLLAR